MSTNLTLLIAAGRIRCRQCKAMSKRTRQQCRAPAMKDKNVCRTHGGLSSGPKTDQGRKRCAEARTTHGNETQAKRAERSRKSAELHQLVDLGNAIGLFHVKVGIKGRPPKHLVSDMRAKHPDPFIRLKNDTSDSAVTDFNSGTQI